MSRKLYMDEYNKKYYTKNTEKRKAQILARQQSISKTIAEYKVLEGCKICGYNKCSRSLQFHHNEDNKEHDIGRMVGQGRSIKSIMKEITKCSVLCANCHGELHAGLVTLERSSSG